VLESGSILNLNDHWFPAFQEAFSNMDDFTEFMHNKYIFFDTDITPYIERLEAMGQDYMARLSTTQTSVSDSESATTVMVHISAPFASRLVEIVAPLDSLTIDVGQDEWAMWSDTAGECEWAHALDRVTVEEYMTSSGESKRPVLVGIETATSLNRAQHDHMIQDMQSLTNADVDNKASSDGSCTGFELTWTHDPYLAVRYVNNQAPGIVVDAELSVAKYDEFTAALHNTYVYSTLQWDHMLDNHIGLEEVTVSISCEASLLTTFDSLKAQPIALRNGALETVDGFVTPASSKAYVGYTGSSMSWEYLHHCQDNELNLPDLCMCTESNNLNMYRELAQDGDAACGDAGYISEY
jgi:hypothetical protein